MILFIVFGLLMTLAWARLAAADIALAEAAIGAGLTGALLLDAIGVLRGRKEDDPSPAPLPGEGRDTGSRTRPLRLVGCVSLARRGVGAREALCDCFFRRRFCRRADRGHA